MMRGLVSCTGIDYCHMALIETKELALKTARELDSGSDREEAPHDALVGLSRRVRQPHGADIGLLGKNVKIGDEIIDAVDVFKSGTKDIWTTCRVAICRECSSR